jgi:hypothetical protein
LKNKNEAAIVAASGRLDAAGAPELEARARR